MLYDAFLFYNEMELLEIRLNELRNVVDRFVIVESNITFQGKPKPLYFWDNRDRFSAFQDRIIHVPVVDMPATDDPWQREYYQRDCIARGLTDCSSDDVIMISDADEIPKADVVAQISDTTHTKIFQMQLCYYYLNVGCDEAWSGLRMLTRRDLEKYPSIQAIRVCRDGLVIPDAGWHFSYMGGPKRIREKLASFSHAEYNKPHINDLNRIAEVIATKADIFNRDHRWELRDATTLPDYVLRNLDKFRPWLCPEPVFHEDWYSDSQCELLKATFAKVASRLGCVVEIGCWEGKSTVALANACFPDTLLAVDSWQGNMAESPDHSTVRILASRDVFTIFRNNLIVATGGNVVIRKMLSEQFWADQSEPIKFCHIDGSHDYRSVRADIEGALRLIVPGGIICGDDIATANTDRDDLEGGVERAVKELLPGYESMGNFWYWQAPAD